MKFLFFMFFTLIATIVALEAKTDHPAAIATARMTGETIDQKWEVKALNQIEKAKDAELIFLGDSITDGWNTQIWNEQLSQYKPANMGISSDGTQHLLYRIELFQKKYPEATPKLFFIMIGTNNVSIKKKDNIGVIEGIMANVDFVYKNYPKSKIIVSTLTPTRRANSGFNKENLDYIDNEVTKRLKKYASSRVSRLNSTKAFLNKDGSQKKELFSDGCHLTQAGYQLWTSLITPELKKRLK